MTVNNHIITQQCWGHWLSNCYLLLI